jgi:outer membrane protein OmpA-like peptidoglycan-associated protein
MKLFIYICFSLACFSSLAQEKTIHIKGRVGCDRSNHGVENALVHLKLSGGYTFTYKTDSSGTYHFDFGMLTPSSCTLNVTTDQSSKSFYVRDGCFLRSKDNGIIPELHDSTDYVKDFVITAAFCEYEPPTILFRRNSILSCNDSMHVINPKRYDTFDSILKELYHILKTNPTIVVEFTGHASALEEKNADALSLYRAQLMCGLMVAKGINPKRLSARGFGSRKRLITDEQIKKAQSQEEKAALHSKNQRVTYRILNWDFKE